MYRFMASAWYVHTNIIHSLSKSVLYGSILMHKVSLLRSSKYIVE